MRTPYDQMMNENFNPLLREHYHGNNSYHAPPWPTPRTKQDMKLQKAHCPQCDKLPYMKFSQSKENFLPIDCTNVDGCNGQKDCRACMTQYWGQRPTECLPNCVSISKEENDRNIDGFLKANYPGGVDEGECDTVIGCEKFKGNCQACMSYYLRNDDGFTTCLPNCWNPD